MEKPSLIRVISWSPSGFMRLFFTCELYILPKFNNAELNKFNKKKSIGMEIKLQDNVSGLYTYKAR